MKGIPKASPVAELAEAIRLQQETILIEKSLLNEQLKMVASEFIKDKLNTVLSPVNLLTSMAGSVSGVIAGLMVNKVVAGSQAGILRKIAGFVLQIAATKGISKIISNQIKNKESKM